MPFPSPPQVVAETELTFLPSNTDSAVVDSILADAVTMDNLEPWAIPLITVTNVEPTSRAECEIDKLHQVMMMKRMMMILVMMMMRVVMTDEDDDIDDNDDPTRPTRR